jgi:hypothetical protein
MSLLAMLSPDQTSCGTTAHETLQLFTKIVGIDWAMLPVRRGILASGLKNSVEIK